MLVVQLFVITLTHQESSVIFNTNFEFILEKVKNVLKSIVQEKLGVLFNQEDLRFSVINASDSFGFVP